MKTLLSAIKVYDTKTREFNTRNLLLENNRFRFMDNGNIDGSYNIENMRNYYLYPSFIDSHLHLFGIGMEKVRYSLNGISSKEDLITAIQTQDSSFIVLRGWDENLLGFFPERKFIDQISQTRKCLLIRKCGHTATCNSPVIEELINSGVKEMDDSDYARGILNERTLEKAQELIHYSKKDLQSLFLTAAEEVKRLGISSVHSDDYHSCHIEDLTDILKKQNQLRIFEKINPKSLQELKELIDKDTFKAHISDYCSIRAVKVFLDGSFGAKTAYLSQPYEGTNSRGVLYMGSEKFSEYVRMCEENNLQLLVHVIGDGALEVALEGFQKAISSFNPLRHRLIHLQMASEEQLKKIKEMNLYLSIQPIFYDSDIDMAMHVIGEKRLEELAYPFKKALDMGIELSLSTDSPVEDFNPFKNLMSATRFFDLKSAFEKYTIASAKAAFLEGKTGMIENGFYADGFLLDKNIFDMDIEDLSEIKPLAIIFDGNLKQYSRLKREDQ